MNSQHLFAAVYIVTNSDKHYSNSFATQEQSENPRSALKIYCSNIVAGIVTGKK